MNTKYSNVSTVEGSTKVFHLKDYGKTPNNISESLLKKQKNVRLFIL